MVGIPNNKAAALAVLGLGPEAGRDAVKAAFRARAKALHPDICPASEASLSGLAEAIAAMRLLEAAEDEVSTEIEINAAQAEAGLIRVVSRIGGNLIVRIPPGVADGSVIAAVGSPACVRIRVTACAPGPVAPAAVSAAIPDFVERFASPSPASRFAEWARRRHTAA